MSTSYMKDVKKWAKHIIRRFGKKKAMIYVKSIRECPCTAVGKQCNKCGRTILKRILFGKKRIKHGTGCRAAGIFFMIWRYKPDFILELKRKLKRMI